MTASAKSGHPGGSLSALDILLAVYAGRIAYTNEPFVVSNGHISPGVYAVLGNMGAIDREDVVHNFRKIGSVFEGHVTRHVPGISFGTGPLGVGVSAACGMAVAQKRQGTGNCVYALMGDGEAQEGQVYEMMHLAVKEKLGKFTVIVDANGVQLTDSIEKVMPIHIPELFAAAGWEVIDIDGHDYDAIWDALAKADASTEIPTLIFARTIMGQGVPFMEEEGKAHKATWHGKAPTTEEVIGLLSQKEWILTEGEKELLATYRAECPYRPDAMNLESEASVTRGIKPGTPIRYEADAVTDCRTAYGKALLNLAKENKNVMAFTADLEGSVMTKFLHQELPDQYVECGIAEQNMVSSSGGASLRGVVPFCSTFGAFISSRAKDQARVNDINATNVKMVATHCGLSVGEDGPTHQCIDDMGSFVGILNTKVLEPADPNHCDRLIRYAATTHGNFYIRMGRHKLPVLTKTDGSPFFDEKYTYEYGQTDTLREGEAVTIVASGPMVAEAMKARELAKIDAEIVIASSIKNFDQNLIDSVRKTGSFMTVEDHNPECGLGSAVNSFLFNNGINVRAHVNLGVREYQLSGTWEDLYKAVGLDAQSLAQVLEQLVGA